MLRDAALLKPEKVESWQVLCTGSGLNARTGVRVQVLESLPSIKVEPHESIIQEVAMVQGTAKERLLVSDSNWVRVSRPEQSCLCLPRPKQKERLRQCLPNRSFQPSQ